MGRLGGFTYRDVTRRLMRLGFVLERQAKGSHELWRNPSTGQRAFLPRHNRSIAEGTLRSILQQAGVAADDFLA